MTEEGLGRVHRRGKENCRHRRGKDRQKFDKRRDNMANFREMRDILTLYHSSEAINDEEFVLLYDEPSI